jgi:hypothetical protein
VEFDFGVLATREIGVIESAKRLKTDCRRTVMKVNRLAGVIVVLILGLFLAYSAAWSTAATPKEEGAFKSKELTFESDVKKAKDERADRDKALREKRMKERKPPTEEEKKKRYQESVSKRYQGIIQQQEAVAARWMKIRELAQQEKAVLTVKEIDKLITEQREQIKATKQQMQDALHPEQARQRKMEERKRLMEERAKYETERKRRDSNSRKIKQERKERSKLEEN